MGMCRVSEGELGGRILRMAATVALRLEACAWAQGSCGASGSSGDPVWEVRCVVHSAVAMVGLERYLNRPQMATFIKVKKDARARSVEQRPAHDPEQDAHQAVVRGHEQAESLVIKSEAGDVDGTATATKSKYVEALGVGGGSGDWSGTRALA